MRYPANHKAETRSRLVEAARRLFRERGFDGVSIDQLMGAAGLTRGGFYAHFSSKEALVAEVLGLEPGLIGKLRAADDEEGTKAAFLNYLDPAVRDGLTQCPFVAHAADARRGPDARAQALSQRIVELIDAADGGGDEVAAIARAVVAVGAAVLSTSVQDAGLADRIQAVAAELLAG